MLVSQTDLQAIVHTLLTSLISPAGPNLSNSQTSFESIYLDVLNNSSNKTVQAAVHEMFRSPAVAQRVKAFQERGTVLQIEDFVDLLEPELKQEEARRAILDLFWEFQNRLTKVPELNDEIFALLPESFVKHQQTSAGDPIVGLAAAYANVAIIHLNNGHVLTALQYLLETQLVFLKSGAVKEYRQVSDMLSTIEEQLDPLEFRDLVQRAFKPTRENGIVWKEYTILSPSEVAKLLHQVQEAQKR